MQLELCLYSGDLVKLLRFADIFESAQEGAAHPALTKLTGGTHHSQSQILVHMAPVQHYTKLVMLP